MVELALIVARRRHLPDSPKCEPRHAHTVVKEKPIAAESGERYLESKFAESLGPAREAMRDLAKSFRLEGLAQNTFSLYERFRPAIPEDATGWGAKGRLDIDRIRSLAPKK